MSKNNIEVAQGTKKEYRSCSNDGCTEKNEEQNWKQPNN